MRQALVPPLGGRRFHKSRDETWTLRTGCSLLPFRRGGRRFQTSDDPKFMPGGKTAVAKACQAIARAMGTTPMPPASVTTRDRDDSKRDARMNGRHRQSVACALRRMPAFPHLIPGLRKATRRSLMATLAMTAILALVPAVHAYERDESAGTRPINTAQTNVPLPPMRPTDLPAAVPVPQLEAPAKEIPSRDPPSRSEEHTSELQSL